MTTHLNAYQSGMYYYYESHIVEYNIHCSCLYLLFLVYIITLCNKATIHQLTTMLSTSKNVLVPGQNIAGARAIIKVKGHQHQYQWLAGGYDLEIGHF